MTIDLSAFAKSNSEIEAESDGKNLPKWVAEGTPTLQRIYHEVCHQKDSIQKSIKEQGDKLSVNDRKIVANRIAKACNVSRSYISERRVPEILALIDQFNRDLEILWSRRSNRSSGLRKLSRKDIEYELMSLRKENERLFKEGLKRDLQSAVAALGVERRTELVAEIQNLRKLIDEKNEAISNLHSQLRHKNILPVK